MGRLSFFVISALADFFLRKEIKMKKIVMKAKEFKKMNDPNDEHCKHIRYVCYVQAKSIPYDLENWMDTNPRSQKMTTNVARIICQSLVENSDFHELNRGIVMSAESVKWNNSTEELEIILDNPEKHGNIDGGHTLNAIFKAKKENTISMDRFVFMEIIVGLDSPVELAAARNTSVQVDLKSIAELEKSFDAIKESLGGIGFEDRIQYKMNEHYNDDQISEIDVREIISIIIMFSQEIYPFRLPKGGLNEKQPIQCYSGKEASLRRFLECNSTDHNKQKNNREVMMRSMRPILPDVFRLWETIETTFASKTSDAGKRYGARKYSKYNDGKVIGKSFFYETDINYYVPKGIMFPLVGAFRALVQVDNDEYYWKKNPIDVWNEIGSKLVAIILDEKAETPDALAKNTNLWSNLFKEVYIYAYM